MPKFTCDCGAIHVLTEEEMESLAGRLFTCRKCGKSRLIPRKSALPAVPSPVSASATSTADEDNDPMPASLAEIAAIDLAGSAPGPLPPLVASIQRQMQGGQSGQAKRTSAKSGWSFLGKGMILLEMWGTLVAFGSYIVAVGGIVFGLRAFARAESDLHEIYGLLCWLIALAGFCGGCAVQLLLEACRRLRRP